MASSEEGQQECDNITITFGQDPTGKVTRGTPINYTWVIRKEPPTCLAGEPYLLEIQGPANVRYPHNFKTPSDSSSEFTGKYSWIVPDDAPIGNYTSYLKFSNDVGSYIAFEVVETLLVIQKLNDINKNGKVDYGVDKRLEDWEFIVTDPFMESKKYSTKKLREIQIEIPKKYEGKYYTIEEILQPRWKPILPIEQPVRVKVPKGVTTTVPFLNIYDTTTKLIIQKFDDTNRNSRIDGNDERLRGWKFKVTDPDGNTKIYYTISSGEIVIEVPLEYAGKDITVEEILQPGWKAILPSKQRVNVPVGETKTVQFLNAETLLLIEKFGDRNRNSKIDGSDERLQGWKFNVTDPDGNTKAYSMRVRLRGFVSLFYLNIPR